jgi:formylglycine-generating enzyme required for sulfatase activity
LVTGGAIDPGPSGPHKDKADVTADVAHGEELAADEDVATFRVRRLLGEGGMGQVYLARDLVLGRLVALKLVRPERLGPAGVSRFMREARITARFNHPHIVTIHGVGTHRGRPYLALEYLDGESLGARLQREHLSVDEIMRIGRAISDALAHAHAAQVLHCDLKPGNVVLAADGRLRVVDFGLAADALEPESRTYAGTPTYMAPEQWLLEPLTDRVDVWALGVLLYECFEHSHPFAAERGVSAIKKAVLSPEQPRPIPKREGIPPEVARLVQSALARDPALRPTASDCRTVLDTALSPLPGMGTAESPFRGLLAFEERHAQVFFGREAEIGALLERMRSETVIPVIGPSGVGKSSFVHAGLIPRLRAQGSWTILSFRPGNAPIRTLAHRLSGMGSGTSGPSVDTEIHAQSDDLATRIRQTPAVAALRLSAIAAANRGKVLLVIDQLEELFTHVSDPVERDRFLEAILNAADDVAGPVRVLLTVRDDFLGRVPGLKSLFVLGPPEKNALRRTITEPLKQVGYDFDTEGMVDAMLSELDRGQGELPLLQFALRQLWDARDEGRRVLLKRAYDRFGGVAGALADHADTLLAGLDSKELQIAKQLLVRLVSPDGTRRILETSTLLAGFGPASEQVLARLISGRLLIQRRSKDSGDPTIELAHESLITRWARLARWLDEGREERALAAELEEATKLWIRRGRPMEETWSGIALETVRHRVKQLGLAVNEEVSAFLQAGALRARQSQIKKRIALTLLATILVTTTIGALYLASEFRSRENEAKRQKDELVRAGANLGELRLELEPFDFDEDLSTRPVDVRELPELSFRLHRANPANPLEPGEELGEMELHVEAVSSTVTTRKFFRVEAPGVQAFLAIEGRNRRGERCAPSWLRLQSLPGFAERQQSESAVLRVPFPTCRASRANMVEIPPGELVFGGTGEPSVEPPSDAEPERVVSLPRFFIDRTEVSNAGFAAFAELAQLSGEDLPNYPDDQLLPNAAKPRHPVTGVTGRTAEAYCRFFGKRLPTFVEWVKAVRGGLTLPDGTVNPAPRRLYSWTGSRIPAGANFAGEQDGCETSCAVDRTTEYPNVYGARDLHGNVQEWGSGWERPGDAKLFMPLFGGGFSDSAEDSVTTSAAANTREARYFDFQIGLRCLDANE